MIQSMTREQPYPTSVSHGQVYTYYVSSPRYVQLVRLLSLELFIMEVQANKLNFCNLELILNKTGYSHIMESKKTIFHFLTWELVEKM